MCCLSQEEEEEEEEEVELPTSICQCRGQQTNWVCWVARKGGDVLMRQLCSRGVKPQKLFGSADVGVRIVEVLGLFFLPLFALTSSYRVLTIRWIPSV